MEPQVADLLSFLLITQIDATWLQEMLVLTLYIMPCTWEPHALTVTALNHPQHQCKSDSLLKSTAR